MRCPVCCLDKVDEIVDKSYDCPRCGHNWTKLRDNHYIKILSEFTLHEFKLATGTITKVHPSHIKLSSYKNTKK